MKFDWLEYNRKEMERFFRIRHLLVHRSGRQRDDTDVAVTYDILADPVNAIHALVGSIFDSIFITLGGEMRNRQPERDLSEVFSKGVVRASFKLSD